VTERGRCGRIEAIPAACGESTEIMSIPCKNGHKTREDHLAFYVRRVNQ
jgi:hypothetical protein